MTRNRATPSRRSPARPELGAETTRRLRLLTGAVILLATVVLAGVLLLAR